jgi:FMN-dependent NADH-azoreductase
VTAAGAAKVMMGAVDRESFLKPALDQVRQIAA